MTVQETLLKNGFYVGKLEELVSDQEQFNRYSDIIMNYEYPIDQWDCFYPLRDPRPNGIEFHKNQEKWPSIIPLADVPARDQYCAENGMTFDQKWYRLLYERDEIGRIKHEYFRGLTMKFVEKAYPYIPLETVRHNDCYALYDDNGCFISRHRDGQLGKFMAIIIYMTPADTWQDGGGEFLCGTDVDQNPVSDKIIPVRGNFVVLDFSRHDAWHEVLPVKNGFKRWSYLNFVRQEGQPGSVEDVH